MEAADTGSGEVRVLRPVPGVAQIVLDRPGALNALSTALLDSLAGACRAVAADAGVRAVVLSSAVSRAFCVGADLKERAGMTDEQILAQRPRFRAAFGALLGLPQPAVAAVHGFALGGGCELALSCDIIVADETAVFGLPETTVGLVPGCGGTQLAARRIGPGRAAEMVLTGRQVPAAEAGRIGLADVGADAGADTGVAVELAGKIAANSPVAVRAARQAIRLGASLDLAAALEVEDAAWRTAATSADRREGIAAFVAKRAPQWPGK
jgi:enoyl-CoA hydratase/carnithine racemase